MEIARNSPNQMTTEATKKKLTLTPLRFCHVLEKICHHLPFVDLKNARLVNHFWFLAATPAWRKRAQITIKDIHNLRDWLSITVKTKKVLPYNCTNWIFQGETIIKLWMDEGFHERDHILPFWPDVENVTFSRWLKRRFRYQIVHPDPARPHHRIHQRVPYWVLTRIGSAYAVNEMLKLCTNLTRFVIEYSLLTTMKGAYIGVRQFANLEHLVELKIYYDGAKWTNTPSTDQNALLVENLRKAEPEEALPLQVSGGNTLIIRILDHSPRLRTITVSSGTSMSARVESWFTRHLLSTKGKLPKLEKYNCQILLQDDICQGLKARPWGLKALHLKTHPGTGVSAGILHDMIASFRSTLQHLELIFIGNPAAGEHSGHCFSGDQLCNLETLEMWGYKGDYAFLWELKKLRSAVIGATDAAYYPTLERSFKDIELLNVKLELRTAGDFVLRLDEGPLIPL